MSLFMKNGVVTEPAHCNCRTNVPRITIQFSYEDGDGNNYEISEVANICPGDPTELDIMADNMITFLQAIGSLPKGSTLFIEPLNDLELDLVTTDLLSLRSGNDTRQQDD